MLRWLRWRDRRERPRPRVVCIEHAMDLAALRSYVEDGRPSPDVAARELIAARTCPACQPRYVKGDEASTPTRNDWGELVCPCCRATWSLEPDCWVAVTAGGLEVIGRDKPLPDGVTIDGTSFEIVSLDEVRALESSLRSALLALPGFSDSFDPRLRTLVDEIVDAAVAAANGLADERAEIWWSISEAGLDPVTAESLENAANEALEEIHTLLSGDAAKSHPGERPIRARRRRHAGVVMSRSAFEALVNDAVASLPPNFAELFVNVAVLVEDHDPDEALYGLYQGTPLTERSAMSPYGHPDRITIYQDTICADCDTEAEVADQVRRTVIHEVGHFFGIDDDRLHELGW